MKREKKVSEMLLDISSMYIEQGNTIEEMQMFLDIVCKCWNMSLLPDSDKNKHIRELIKIFRKRSNNTEFLQILKKDIHGLIKAKNDLYPDVLHPIAHAKIEGKAREKYKITAAFIRSNP